MPTTAGTPLRGIEGFAIAAEIQPPGAPRLPGLGWKISAETEAAIAEVERHIVVAPDPFRCGRRRREY